MEEEQSVRLKKMKKQEEVGPVRLGPKTFV
jgi:hypothetical protein